MNFNLFQAAFYLWLFFCTALLPADGGEFEWKGQFSGWLNVGPGAFSENTGGLRYIPTFSFEKALDKNRSWDLEISLNGFGAGGLTNFGADSDVKAYRARIRYKTQRWEWRLGRQQLDFGSATLLRSLRWFDRIDPRDPLQLTGGVDGLLGRYYFLNNANIWVWGLYGNEGTKGWESFSSVEDKPEYGGRIQAPLGTGEIAGTYHHRRVDLADGLALLSNDPVSEHKYALDGKWDWRMGLWFEGVLIRQDNPQLRRRQFLTLGADYTVPMGNGVRIMAEHLHFNLSPQPPDIDQSFNFSALYAHYPLGLFDQISTLTWFDWESHQWYPYITWARNYDRWGFYANLYQNPKTGNFFYPQDQSQNTAGPGKGIQLLIVFHH